MTQPMRYKNSVELERMGRKTPAPGRVQHRPRPLSNGQASVQDSPTKIYGRVGDLEVRLAQSDRDIRQAQELRYHVFCKEMSALPLSNVLNARRDEDRYDVACDHLLVIDHGTGNAGKQSGSRGKVVGTYRILRQEIAFRHEGFYSQGEYDLAPLLAVNSTLNFVELGRSCVLAPYRNRRTLELLWHGIWTYVREHNLDVMFGCASFPGTQPQDHAMALSFLHHNVRAPSPWTVSAHRHLKVDMNLLPANAIDSRAAMKALPPLIKGYLRLGAYVGDGAVVDHQFGTTDVLMILPVEAINPRYFAKFGTREETAARIAKDKLNK